KPYAVKPTSTIVAEAIGATPKLIAVDMEFACRAGTTGLQCVMGLVVSGMIDYGMAIGADTSQGRPGDELEYTTGCGAAAFILGRDTQNSVAEIEASSSFVTDTPDFWRREGEFYPQHAHRFTGKPAYFRHIVEASKLLMEELGLKPSDYKYVVFHQPNIKFPLRVAKMLGFRDEQVKPGLLSPIIGNAYAGSSLLGLVAVLDVAEPGDRIFLASFGSGAGSDAFSIKVTEGIRDKRLLAPLLKTLIDYKKYIDYALYVKHRKKIRLK
ncbi:MAG: hydroxymethylglutaryl-CoA synthase, partial [Thermoprotei archaeon]